MTPKGSVTRSVRIEKDADERLRKLADQSDTSVNTLVNRALRKFVEWDAYGEKFGFVTFPGIILVKMMDLLTEEEATERVIILKHGSGPRWSTFYKVAAETAFREHLNRDIHVEKSENQVVLRLRWVEKRIK